MNSNSLNTNNINTNSKDFLEKQLKELDTDFNILYQRMNQKRKELHDNSINNLKKDNNKK
jgi:hypothetical protein